MLYQDPFDPNTAFADAPSAVMYLGRDASAVIRVSPPDADLLVAYSWTWNPCGKGKHYARTTRASSSRAGHNQFYLHRAIASRFLGECPPKHVVDHIDGDTTNNTRENLRYMCAWANRWRSHKWANR